MTKTNFSSRKMCRVSSAGRLASESMKVIVSGNEMIHHTPVLHAAIVTMPFQITKRGEYRSTVLPITIRK